MASKADLVLGKAAILHGFATQEQVNECLAEVDRIRKTGAAATLLQLLLEKKIVTPDDEQPLLRARMFEEARPREKRLATLAVKNRMATAAQVEECFQANLQALRSGDQLRPLLEIMRERGYITDEAREMLLLMPAEGDAEPVVLAELVEDENDPSRPVAAGTTLAAEGIIEMDAASLEILEPVRDPFASGPMSEEARQPILGDARVPAGEEPGPSKSLVTSWEEGSSTSRLGSSPSGAGKKTTSRRRATERAAGRHGMTTGTSRRMQSKTRTAMARRKSSAAMMVGLAIGAPLVAAAILIVLSRQSHREKEPASVAKKSDRKTVLLARDRKTDERPLGSPERAGRMSRRTTPPIDRKPPRRDPRGERDRAVEEGPGAPGREPSGEPDSRSPAARSPRPASRGPDKPPAPDSERKPPEGPDADVDRTRSFESERTIEELEQLAKSAGYRADYARAIQYFTLLVGKAPGEPRFWLGRAKFYLKAGRLNHGRRDLEKAESLCSDRSMLMQIVNAKSQTFSQLLEIDSARNEARRFFEISGSHPHGYYLMGLTERAAGNLDLAIENARLSMIVRRTLRGRDRRVTAHKISWVSDYHGYPRSRTTRRP